ncbi:MAG: carbohydrate ABC transporter permease [Dehalococcoidales bacterium]|nr:carbohydrate ABC transporter permease [Dehalococcoidales bacterium]
MAIDKAAAEALTQKWNFRNYLARIPLNVFLLIGCLVMVFPFVWMIISTFKSPAEIEAMPPVWIPQSWSLTKYFEVFQMHPMGWYFVNSFIVATVTTLSGLFLGSLAAYGFAKHSFKFDKPLFFIIVSGMMLPFYVKLIPWFLVIKGIGLQDSLAGVILPDLLTVYGVFWLRQYMIGIPDDLLDSARIDGASEWKIYWKIVLPQCIPALAALAIFRFMWAWNDFFWPMIVLNTDTLKTVSVGVASYYVGPWMDYARIMAAATVAILPTVIVYFMMQKRFIQGVTLTGLKQ